MAELDPLRLYIYAEARRMFTLGLWGWPALVLEAFLVGDGYVPDLEEEIALDRVTPVLASVSVSAPETDSHAFNSTSPITFPNVVLTEDATKFVLASDSGVPILFASFPPIRASAIATNIPVLLANDWLFRL